LGSLPRAGQSVFYYSVLVLLIAAYLVAAYIVRKDNRRITTVLIVGGFLLFALMFLFIPSFCTRDLFSYAFQGRAMTVYKSNPFLLTPAMQKADVFRPLIDWQNSASVYGPVFNSLSAIVCFAGRNSIASNVLGFKILATVFFAGSLPLVYWLTKRISPGRENFAVLFTAWSPILIPHICGGGHNDSIMIFFVLVGFYLCRHDHAFWGLVSITLAALTKATAALVLLPYLVYMFRSLRGNVLRKMCAAMAVVVSVTAALYIPFWAGPRMFKAMIDIAKHFSAGSLPTFVRGIIAQMLLATGVSKHTAGTLATSVASLTCMLVFLTLSLYFLHRVRDFRSMTSSTAAIVLVWFFTAPYILPWYLSLAITTCVICGWNANTLGTLMASTLFTAYWLPDTARYHPRTLTAFNQSPAVLLVSVPFALAFFVWLSFATPVAHAFLIRKHLGEKGS